MTEHEAFRLAMRLGALRPANDVQYRKDEDSDRWHVVINGFFTIYYPWEWELVQEAMHPGRHR